MAERWGRKKKRNWIKGSREARCWLGDRNGRRGECGGETERLPGQNRLWRPDYRKLNTSLPTDNKGQGEATPTHLAQHHLSKAPFNRSNTINGFPTRVQTKRFLEWDNQEWKKKPPPQIQSDILCGPVRILYRKSWRGPTLSLHKAALHNQSLWVMTHGLLPQLLPFLSFSFSDSLIPTGYIREKTLWFSFGTLGVCIFPYHKVNYGSSIRGGGGPVRTSGFFKQTNAALWDRSQKVTVYHVSVLGLRPHPCKRFRTYTGPGEYKSTLKFWAKNN